MNNREKSARSIESNVFLSYEEAAAEIASLRIKDPTSAGYVRQIVRPRISFLRVVVNITLPTIITLVIFFVLWLTALRFFVALIIGVVFFSIYTLVRLKCIAIWTIKVYQATASDARRLNCRFEPSCSGYSIEAYKKYGFVRGTIKTIKRLKKCRPPNGGIDELD